MTCIVGLEHEGVVWLGGDSAVTWSGDDAIHAVTHKKIIRRGGMLFGMAGCLGPCTVAASAIHPEPYSKGDVREHVLAAVVLPLRALLKDNKMLDDACELLVGVEGRLLYAGTDGSVHGFGGGYGAIGSGTAYALGALHTTKKLGPRARLRAALEATAHHCASVAPPFHFLRSAVT